MRTIPEKLQNYWFEYDMKWVSTQKLPQEPTMKLINIETINELAHIKVRQVLCGISWTYHTLPNIE